jgi:hypothetical protein
MIQFKDKKDATINSIYKPSDEIQAVRRNVYERFHLMKAGRVDRYGNDLEAKWRKWEKQYEAWRPDRSADDWQSTIVPPFTTTIVEKALAEMIDQTVQPTIVARGIEDIPKAKLMNYIKDYTWEIGDGDLEAYAAIKQALILGKTVWQEDYWQDKRIVKFLKKFDMDKNEEEYVKKEMTDFDDVYGEAVSLYDFYIDPLAQSINRGRFKAQDCIRRYVMDYNAFVESYKGSIFDQFGAVQYVRPGASSDYYQYYKPASGMLADQVEVLFYWGRNPDKLVIVANDVVIRDGPNPYMHKQLPFAEGSDVKRIVGSGFYAIGEPELLESIQDELTTLRRMRIDRQHLDIFKTFFVSNKETIDEDEAIIAPSRFVYVDDPNSIRPLEYRDINPSAYHEEELLKQDGRDVTGILSPQPTSTATDAAIQKESTMRALRMKIWLLSRELFTGIIRLRASNIVQFYKTPKVENIVGEGKIDRFRSISTPNVQLETARDGSLVEKKERGEHFFEIKPEFIIPYYGSYDLRMSAEPTLPVSKPLLQQKVNELSNNPIIMAAIEQGHIDPGKMADKILEVNDFDPDELKAEVPQQGGQQGMVDEQQLLELANRENEIMLEGKKLGPTPYASRGHTNIHLAFINSEPVKNLPRAKFDDFINNISAHVLGESTAQELREQGGSRAGMPQPPTSVGQGVEGSEAKATNPALMIGAEGVPNMQ